MNSNNQGTEEYIYAPFFTPALWRQRRELIWKILKQNSVTSVIDMGCGEGSVLSSLISCMDEPPIMKLIGIDINGETLEECKERCKPTENDFQFLRERPLSVNIYQGTLSNPYKELLNYDCIILSEVIEHLYSKDLELLPKILFEDYNPSLIIISTPNAEFNVMFPNLNYLNPNATFRDDDHKFEWTRKEFQSWCNIQADKYNYEVIYNGVGIAPLKEDQYLGYCTQFGIFKRKQKINKERGYNNSLKLIMNYEYPYFDKIVDDEYRINILKQFSEYFIPIEEEEKVGGEKKLIDVEQFWSIIEIRQAFSNFQNFIRFLKDELRTKNLFKLMNQNKILLLY